MQFAPVNWHEGLFLQPHHFQAWDRYWAERISLGEQWQSPFGYGLLEVSINTQALAAGFLQVDVLRCRTPGGVLIDHDQGMFAERRDLRPALTTSASSQVESSAKAPFLDVVVAVPRLQLGVKNVDAPEHPNGARFRSQWLDLPDELDAASIKPIEVRRINAKLLLSTDDLAGYDCLKIARLRRSEQESTVFQLDAQYIPPLLQCSAWPLLQSQVLSATYDLMQQYSEQLGQQLIDAGNAIHGQTPIDLQRILVLQAINPAASIFRVLSTSRGIHPMTAYLELSRLAGALDLLHPERIAQATLPYDHENLGGIFFQLWRRILRTLESIQKVPYHQTTFVGTPHGMQISLAPQHFQKYRRWFIGIQKGAVSNDVVHDLLAPRHLDWKMGSATQVDRMFVQRAPGVELRACTQIPAALPRSDHWVFYEVMGLDSAAWKDVESTGTLAFRIRESMIVDRERLPGDRTLQVAYHDQSIPLQFALFGVL